MEPFIKWAGGKRWLARRLPEVPDFARSASRYVEPFLGGGAMFFATGPSVALLSDLNSDLIATYCTVRDSAEQVGRLLQTHSELHSEEYYYAMRSSKPQDQTELAAWFLYLNRTCFNGIYRVNKKGIFNVPKGTKSSVCLSSDNFPAAAEALKKAKIVACDFEETLEQVGPGDFVFADPPYTVKHNFNGFVKYNEKMFSWSDQERLARCAVAAASRGAFVLISNANHSSIRELYRSADRVVIARQTVIGGCEDARGTTTEMLIALGGDSFEPLRGGRLRYAIDGR